jgi:SAM-dependent methyltransferase
MNEPPDFNRLARLYRWMEVASFGPWLWWCRCAWLGEFTGCRHALVIGDGDGRFTRRLLDINSSLVVDAVDASPAMLAALMRRAGPHANRVRIHLADARAWQPQNPPYDLVVTHFFLDCLSTDEAAALALTVSTAVSERALWLVSEFAIPDSGFGRLLARPLVAGLYRAFGWLTGLTVRTLPDYSSGLYAAGFELTAQRRWLAGLLVSQLWRAADARIPANPT